MKCCKSELDLSSCRTMHQPSIGWNNVNGNINQLGGKPNGHFQNGLTSRPWSNGILPRADDKQSTLSRYWTVERPRNGKINSYHAVKRSCRERGILFEDASFPPNNRSLSLHKKLPLQPIIWARPHELCQRPKFTVENCSDNLENSRFDIEVGELGDVWLLAAISSLTLTPRFLERVVPPDQSFDSNNYCGVFRFRFWHFGEWKDVLIDDRLPTFRGRLIYIHSSNPTVFWAALLEKAYAKLYGCYENLHLGFTTRAFQDLTGGIVQSFGLNNQEKYLTFQVLNSAVPRSTLIIASINPEKETKRQLRLRNGLLTQSAYSVTGLARVRNHLGEIPLVRLRNPWGKGDWTGPWSERSWEWEGLNDRDKEILSTRAQNEGEFWMSFEDFVKNFTHLDLVHVSPDDWMNEPALQAKQPWRAVLARRRWRSGYNAGGSPIYIETTAVNPQFRIQIPRSSGNKCHVVVSVTQHYETYSIDNKKRKPPFAIGFAVYEVPPTTVRLTQNFVTEHKPLDVTNHSIAREVVTFFTLPPGDYIVVPQTNVPNCDSKFLLRIFTDEQSNIWEVNEDNMVFRNISTEYFEEAVILPDGKPLISKLLLKYPVEVDAVQLQKILKSHWKAYLTEKPSLELCKSLIMLRDYNISGKINVSDIPILIHILQFWRMAFQKLDKSHGNKTSSYNLRTLLWEAGTTVSNKVLECLVLRFSKNMVLTSECFVMAMVRLYLAHERYHSLDTKMKKKGFKKVSHVFLM
ncbi:Calpain A, putative [Pediculus humanus corporis]|uniref:Calpain A, putative n=1 Tax=Pediculus humanus subsp. corporis TaxID=121224 RepID=E0VKU5_PEDHC|nr:Calpain A, putative [Pediculus humanus corporis]EEB14001.1 Calpain A, putative [Pediculus humanus corporis]